MDKEPAYLELFRDGELERRVDIALSRLKRCDICPRSCGVDRSSGGTGYCRIARSAVVASYGSHFGEEAPLSGKRGSGTIFFSGCNLSCQYCQNHDISQSASGEEMDASALADVMIELEGFGCHNINLVSPTHVVPQVLEALERACMKGLRLPLIYNTGGYDSISTLLLLDGIIDIYMPDMKYSEASVGGSLSLVKDYPEVNRNAVREMHRQTGDLEVDGNGIAARGLLVRHLLLPGGLSGTRESMRFLSKEVSRDTYVNIMGQYRPEYRAMWIPGMDRRPTRVELEAAFEAARSEGLHRFEGRF